MVISELQTSIDWSLLQMGKAREVRLDAIRELVTTHYSENGAAKKVPVNFIEMAVSIYLHQLAPRVPQAMVTVKNRSLKPQAAEFEQVLSDVAKDVSLGDTIRLAVLHALFSMGIVKVGICQSSHAQYRESGEPFVDIVSIDDYFMDMTAKDRRRIQYEGNDYWMPLSDIKAMYGRKAAGITGDDNTFIGTDGTEQATGIGADEGGTSIEKQVRLRDVYIHHTNELITYATTTKTVLDRRQWDGPDGGPYINLFFTEVPDNLMPLPPVALWKDLHELANALFRKLAREADSFKNVQAFSGSDEDVEAFRRARDGDGIRYSGQPPQSLTAGGINQQSLLFFLQTKDLFSYFAGNLDTLGGLSASAETVGQEGLISNAAGARIASMRGSVIAFAAKVFKRLAWYEWTDPVRVRQVERKVPNTSVSIVTQWSPETRNGEFIDFNFDIDVYSLQDDSPTAKMQRLGHVFNGFIMPLLPMFAQFGATINMKEMIDLLAKFTDLPELKNIVTFDNVLPEQESPPRGGNPQPQIKPAETKRTYERISRPGATRNGKDQIMSGLLAGGNPQPNDLAALGRSVS